MVLSARAEPRGLKGWLGAEVYSKSSSGGLFDLTDPLGSRASQLEEKLTLRRPRNGTQTASTLTPLLESGVKWPSLVVLSRVRGRR